CSHSSKICEFSDASRTIVLLACGVHASSNPICGRGYVTHSTQLSPVLIHLAKVAHCFTLAASHDLHHFRCHILFIGSYTPDMTNPDFKLSPDLIPSAGRFGCVPSKVRRAQTDAMVNGAKNVIGTSHRQAAAKDLVGEVRNTLSQLISLPEGYKILLSPGGATAFWPARTFSLMNKKSGNL